MGPNFLELTPIMVILSSPRVCLIFNIQPKKRCFRMFCFVFPSRYLHQIWCQNSQLYSTNSVKYACANWMTLHPKYSGWSSKGGWLKSVNSTTRPSGGLLLYGWHASFSWGRMEVWNRIRALNCLTSHVEYGGIKVFVSSPGGIRYGRSFSLYFKYSYKYW